MSLFIPFSCCCSCSLSGHFLSGHFILLCSARCGHVKVGSVTTAVSGFHDVIKVTHRATGVGKGSILNTLNIPPPHPTPHSPQQNWGLEKHESTQLSLSCVSSCSCQLHQRMSHLSRISCLPGPESDRWPIGEAQTFCCDSCDQSPAPVAAAAGQRHHVCAPSRSCPRSPPFSSACFFSRFLFFKKQMLP